MIYCSLCGKRVEQEAVGLISCSEDVGYMIGGKILTERILKHWKLVI